MPGTSAFRSDDARAAYCQLYDAALATSAIPVTESDVDTSFGITHVLTAGDPSKPPLVAMHAKSFSSTMWLPLLPTLTASHHVRMLDAIGGVNKSVAAGVMSSPPRVVEWIDQALDTLDIEQGAFVAASIGAWMATHYTMARPDRVERLAMLAPAGIVSSLRKKWLVKMIAAVRYRPTPGRPSSRFASFSKRWAVPRRHAFIAQSDAGRTNRKRYRRASTPSVACSPKGRAPAIRPTDLRRRAFDASWPDLFW